MPELLKRLVVEQPTVEPVTTAEAKSQLRVDGTDEDALIGVLISAARDAAEQYCNRYFARAEIAMVFDRFPAGVEPLELVLPDMAALTSVKYLDTLNTETTLTGATLDADRGLLLYADGWPEGSNVVVTVSVGPDIAGSPAGVVPAGVKQAILMLVADLFENRAAQGVVQVYENPAAMRMLTPYRVWMGV